MAKVPISVSIDDKDWEQVKAEAKATERTRSQIVTFAIREYFAKKKAKRQKPSGVTSEGEAG